MLLTKLLAFALYSYCTKVDVQMNKIKETTKLIKISAYSAKDKDKIVSEIQQLIVDLQFQLEELDGE